MNETKDYYVTLKFTSEELLKLLEMIYPFYSGDFSRIHGDLIHKIQKVNPEDRITKSTFMDWDFLSEVKEMEKIVTELEKDYGINK